MAADGFQIDGDQIAREALQPFLIAGEIVLRMAFRSIRSARCMTVAMNARHAYSEQNREFAKKYGTNMGFLEIGTEDAGILREMEARFRKSEIEYSRLPDLQKGDGKTQYLFNMDDIDALNDLIHEYETEKLGKLAELKSVHAPEEEYQAAKMRLDERMPGFSVITAEDYAKTSVRDGKDTAEFLELEKSAELELGKSPLNTELSPDYEVADMFRSIERGRSVSSIEKTERVKPEQVLNRVLPARRRGR